MAVIAGLSGLCFPYTVEEVLKAAEQQSDGHQALMGELAEHGPGYGGASLTIDQAQARRNHFDALAIGLRRLERSQRVYLNVEDIKNLGITA